MATQYTTTRFPVAFIPNDGSTIANGTPAKAGTVGTIVENQHFLAFGDTDLVNCMAGGPHTNITRTFSIWVPPFCQYASFHFHVARDFNGTSTTLSYLDIASPAASSRTTSIPFGEDLAVTGKAMSPDKAGWIDFDGIPDNLEPDMPTALQLFSDANVPETLTGVNVTITIPANVYVYTAAYRILPPRRIIVVKS